MALNFYAEFHGLIPHRRVLLQVIGANLGGGDPAGILTPDDVVLVCDASRYTPKLLQAFVDQSSHKVEINGYEPNVQGIEKNFIRITLTGAKVTSFHESATAASRFEDTLHLSFVSLDYDFVADNADFVWTPA
jgi:type VI protein secretion system component Hcp